MFLFFERTMVKTTLQGGFVLLKRRTGTFHSQPWSCPWYHSLGSGKWCRCCAVGDGHVGYHVSVLDFSGGLFRSYNLDLHPLWCSSCFYELYLSVYRIIQSGLSLDLRVQKVFSILWGSSFPCVCATHILLNTSTVLWKKALYPV